MTFAYRLPDLSCPKFGPSPTPVWSNYSWPVGLLPEMTPWWVLTSFPAYVGKLVKRLAPAHAPPMRPPKSQPLTASLSAPPSSSIAQTTPWPSQAQPYIIFSKNPSSLADVACSPKHCFFQSPAVLNIVFFSSKLRPETSTSFSGVIVA